jgi:UDP-N-acetyl-D-mannosaminuronic acid transferase (WecB/TagA/CpsF family)
MPADAESKYRRILGIRFFTGAPAEAVEIGLRGGLVVVPAAPGLVEMESNPAYREAVLNSDLAITDSGFMVLLWNLIKFEKITRVSGLEYLKLLIAQPVMREAGAVVWVMPNATAREKAVAWLNARAVPARIEDCYLAPVYDRTRLVDPALAEFVKARRPRHVFVALGGGVQETLGYWLKREIGYSPGIHCIGAAIGFLSGDQVNIPDWADHFFLGWFFRCVSQPGKFLPRYWRARRLLPILLKYRENPPTLTEPQL